MRFLDKNREKNGEKWLKKDKEAPRPTYDRGAEFNRFFCIIRIRSLLNTRECSGRKHGYSL